MLQRIGRSQIDKCKLGRSEGCTGDAALKNALRSVGTPLTAAVRSYVSVLDTLIIKDNYVVDELYYEKFTTQKIYTQNNFNTKIS